MKRTLLVVGVFAVLLVLLTFIGREPWAVLWGRVSGQPFYRGRPAGSWSRLLSADPASQSEAFQTLEVGGAEAVPVLAAVLRDQPGTDAEVRCLAAELLGKSGAVDENGAGALVDALDDPDPHVRSVVSASLAQAGVSAETAVPALIALLKREPNAIHVRALSEYRAAARPGLSLLEEILANRNLDTETRWNAARTIGKIGPAAASAVPALVACLTDDAATIREHAAEALGDIGPAAEQAVTALAGVLDDPAPRVRRDGVRSLGQIGDASRAAVKEVRSLLEDPEPIVRDAARDALQLIAPDQLPPSPEKPDDQPSDSSQKKPSQ